MCLDDARALKLGQNSLDERLGVVLFFRASVKKDLNSTTAEHIISSPKRFAFYQKTHTYEMGEFSENTV